MSGDGVRGVASVLTELDLEALAASDLMSLHSTEELGGLPCEHGANYQLNVPLELRESLMLGAVWC
jgi:hypothetical protein